MVRGRLRHAGDSRHDGSRVEAIVCGKAERVVGSRAVDARALRARGRSAPATTPSAGRSPTCDWKPNTAKPFFQAVL